MNDEQKQNDRPKGRHRKQRKQKSDEGSPDSSQRHPGLRRVSWPTFLARLTCMCYALTRLSPAAEEDKEYLAWKAEKEREKVEKAALEMAQTNARLNAQLEMIRQATPMYVPQARLSCFVRVSLSHFFFHPQKKYYARTCVYSANCFPSTNP